MENEKNVGVNGPSGDSDLEAMLKGGEFRTKEGRGPLEKLAKRYHATAVICALFCVLVAVVIGLFPVWQFDIVMGLLFAYSLWAAVTCRKMESKIKSSLAPSGALLAELKRLYRQITKLESIQRYLNLAVWVLGIIGGKMLGYMIGSGEPLGAYMLRPSSLIEMAVAALVLLPAFYLVTRAVTRKYAGAYLDGLKRNIDELEKGN